MDFVNWVSNSGYCNGSVDVDEFVEELPHEFLRAANGCLAFARRNPTLLWSLPREDIEVVVDSGSPSLFKDASSATKRLKFFLGNGVDDVLESEKPITVDLMRFLLNYARMAIISPENMATYNRVESSVRKLFSELAKSRGTPVEPFAPVEKQFTEGHEQPLRPFGKDSEMKKGDWICPRCSFMNFAKNSECFECEEPRPKKYLTGKEWECPQCNFFNFGRNVVCLRCDCKKPSVNQQSWFTKITQLEKSSDMSGSVADEDFLKNKIIRNSDNPQNSDGDLETPCEDSNVRFKISQCLDDVLGERSSIPYTSNQGADNGDGSQSLISSSTSPGDEEDFPEIMPMRKGENRFVISKKKDRSLTSPMYKRRTAMEHPSNKNYVPFVPFPPGYFSKDEPKEGSDSDSDSTHVTSNNSAVNSYSGPDPVFNATNNVDQTSQSYDAQSRSGSCESSGNERVREIWKGRSLEGSGVKEADPLDMSEEAKADRWFRRVAQIKDISELSQIPDEDFPSIMPMRKGVNRFVVSKRKTPLERRLTSSKYRRNLPTVSSDPLKKEDDSS